MACCISSGLESSAGRDENVDRLFKIFTFKCLQIIVQSRIETQAVRSVKDSSSAEYFCITIPDNQIIEEHIRRALDGVKTFPVRGQCVCVEISLVTNDGEQMFLEEWNLGFNLSSLDMSASRIQHIFTRMGVTLKSLLCATRAVPAYRLAKNQGEKEAGYRLKYRFYLGKPQTHLLGEGYKTVHAGSVPTAYGLLSVMVSFRTKLLLSPEMSALSVTVIEVTDNYFIKEYRAASAPPTVSDPRSSPSHTRFVPRSESAHHFPTSPSSFEREQHNEKRAEVVVDDGVWTQSRLLNLDELPEPVVGAFLSHRHSQKKVSLEVLPFEALMRRSMMVRQENKVRALSATHGTGGDRSDGGEEDTSKVEDDKENSPSSSPDVACRQKMEEEEGMEEEEEFVLVDKPPFAADDDPRDVKSFLSVMFRPANLYELSDTMPSVGDYLSNIHEFVCKLEKDMPELDQFCQSIISSHCGEQGEEEQQAAAFLS